MISTVFEVSGVSQADKPLPEVPYYEAVRVLLKQPAQTIESCSQYYGRLVANVRFHPVVAAIHMAFNDHRPLCLSPDMIWLLIGQGLANHINVNAEQLRSQFVKHEGKVRIKVIRDDFIKESPENPWSEVFGEFSAEIRKHIGDATHDLLIPNFSTTSLVEKAAAEIVLLDAMQSYFDYGLSTACGIPKIKLEGTVADWQELLKRTKGIAQFGLHWWIDSLIPILEQFITAIQGNPDRRFWQSMYKFNVESSGSGDPYITGWITSFFPYLKDGYGKFRQQNHWLIENSMPLQKLPRPVENDSGRFYRFTTGVFPSGLAKAPFSWEYYELSYEMEFLSGFLGVRQDPEDLFLRPEIGWVVRGATTP
jgi:hypothetical protein